MESDSTNLAPPPSGLLLQGAPDAMVLVDEQGRIQLVSDEAVRLFGYSRDELLAIAIDDLVPEAERGAHRAHRTRYRVSPRRRPMGSGLDLRARRKDGSTVPVEIALSPIEHDGQVWVLASLRDVSVRLEAERHQRLIRRAIDATREAVFLFDQVDLCFVYVNQGALDQTGYERSELLGGMTPVHIKPEFSEAEFRALLQPLVDGDLESRTFVTSHRRKDGTDVPVEVTVELPQLQEQETGDEVFVALARDVSDRLERERRELEQAAEFRAAFEHHLVPTAIISGADGSRGEIVAVNARFEELVGRHGGELRGLRLTDLADPSDVAVVEALLDPRRATPGSAVEARLRVGEGAVVWVAMAASPMDDGAAPDRVVIQFQDVTAQIEATSERDRHRRALTTLADRERIARDLHDMVIQRLFAAGMSLQAVTPLAQGVVAERLAETVDALDEAIAEVRTTIFELGNNDEAETFADQVERVVATRTAVAGLVAEVRVEVDEPPTAEVGESLLATLGEALANTVRHAEAGQVEVSIFRDDGRLVLRVVDDGVGVDPSAPRGHGIDNMMWRATNFGGRCVVEPGGEQGTVLHWEVPVDEADEGSDSSA